MAPALEAVTFDFWNTLIAEGVNRSPRERLWASMLRDAGFEVDQAVIERAMGDVYGWFDQEWVANRVVSPAALVERFLTVVGVDSPRLADEMVAALHSGLDPTVVTTAPEIGDALEALRSAGVRVGIICDVGWTPSSALRRYLDHHGLLAHFDAWSFSDEVGCYKPDRRIFDHAREALAVTGPMAHVGDLRRTDVAGARAAGWTAVRYAGLYDDRSERPDGDLVISSHLELAASLLG